MSEEVGVFLEYIFKWHRVRWHLNMAAPEYSLTQIVTADSESIV
jgi:hypothetical protein